MLLEKTKTPDHSDVNFKEAVTCHSYGTQLCTVPESALQICNSFYMAPKEGQAFLMSGISGLSLDSTFQSCSFVVLPSPAASVFSFWPIVLPTFQKLLLKLLVLEIRFLVWPLFWWVFLSGQGIIRNKCSLLPMALI